MQQLITSLSITLSVLLCLTTTAFPQGNTGGGGQGGGGQGGGGQGGGGQGGGNQQQTGGILIDAAGIVRPRPQPNRKLAAKLLKDQQAAFIAKTFDDDLKTFSERRCVSLVQLEAECERLLAAGSKLTDDVRHLAGLQRIDYLFFDLGEGDRSGDIVIAGPAEGFAPDSQDRMVGLTTDRPALRLDDLIVALNATYGGQSSIGCSIDPEPGRLAQMGDYIRNNSNASSPSVAAKRYRRMSDILGLQNIRVFGVPDDSHFANVLVEADFRMKRISLGVEPSGVRGLRSHLSLLRPNGNSIQRWWFVPFYVALSASDDRMAFQLTGQRAQLLAQEEISSLGGDRSNSAFTRATTEQFAKMFTERFPELAARTPIFAEMQNLFDLTVIAALLKQESFPDQIGWPMTTFAAADSRLVGSYTVPRSVESASTFRRANRGMILGLVGGVTIEPQRVLSNIETPAEDALRLDGVKTDALARDNATSHRWWWD